MLLENKTAEIVSNMLEDQHSDEELLLHMIRKLKVKEPPNQPKTSMIQSAGKLLAGTIATDISRTIWKDTKNLVVQYYSNSDNPNHK